MEIMTADLSKFGNLEIDKAIELLKAYRKQGAENLGDGLTLNFNTRSGNIFLSDDDYNVYMMNGDNLEQFFNCGYCGYEGFKEDMNHEPQDKDCTDYLKQIGVIKDTETEE